MKPSANTTREREIQICRQDIESEPALANCPYSAEELATLEAEGYYWCHATERLLDASAIIEMFVAPPMMEGPAVEISEYDPADIAQIVANLNEITGGKFQAGGSLKASTPRLRALSIEHQIALWHLQKAGYRTYPGTGQDQEFLYILDMGDDYGYKPGFPEFEDLLEWYYYKFYTPQVDVISAIVQDIRRQNQQDRVEFPPQ